MAEKACVKRLQKEYRALCKEPVSNIISRPSPNDILEWHYVLEGSSGTPFAGYVRKQVEAGRRRNFFPLKHERTKIPFVVRLFLLLEEAEMEGGYYYGKIKFPPEYPYKPPGITMITPNGRFMPQKKICLSMSDFHPESWNPMWFVSSILTGLLSFMMDNSPTTGSVNTTTEVKQCLAKASLAFNCKNITFKKIFPEYVEKFNEQQFSEQNNSETGRPAQANNTDARADKDNKNAGANLNRVDAAAKEERGNKKQSLPTWMMILLVSIFGMVMALPLLQL